MCLVSMVFIFPSYCLVVRDDDENGSDSSTSFKNPSYTWCFKRSCPFDEGKDICVYRTFAFFVINSKFLV